MPNVPNPQTNLGTLEHTGVPITDMENITDIIPDFSWMTSQYKFHTTFNINKNAVIGDLLYTTRVVSSDGVGPVVLGVNHWYDVPFASSMWWNGKVSYRFTIIKPPRVPGKLLIRFRQDAFNQRDSSPKINNSKAPVDTKFRSVVKEWDLAQSNQFEFDITASTPIRARPTHVFATHPQIKEGDETKMAIADYETPWTNYEMGRITVEVAQNIIPGSIFPDEFEVIVEKAFKDAVFYTPTDMRCEWNNPDHERCFLSIYHNPNIK